MGYNPNEYADHRRKFVIAKISERMEILKAKDIKGSRKISTKDFDEYTKLYNELLRTGDRIADPNIDYGSIIAGSWQLAFLALGLGLLSEVPKQLKEKFREEFREELKAELTLERLQNATATKVRVVQARRDKLEKSIREIVKRDNLTLSSGIAFAEGIRPELEKYYHDLEDIEKCPSISTIRTAIRKIKGPKNPRKKGQIRQI